MNERNKKKGAHDAIELSASLEERPLVAYLSRLLPSSLSVLP